MSKTVCWLSAALALTSGLSAQVEILSRIHPYQELTLEAPSLTLNFADPANPFIRSFASTPTVTFTLEVPVEDSRRMVDFRRANDPRGPQELEIQTYMLDPTQTGATTYTSVWDLRPDDGNPSTHEPIGAAQFKWEERKLIFELVPDTEYPGPLAVFIQHLLQDLYDKSILHYRADGSTADAFIGGVWSFPDYNLSSYRKSQTTAPLSQNINQPTAISIEDLERLVLEDNPANENDAGTLSLISDLNISSALFSPSGAFAINRGNSEFFDASNQLLRYGVVARTPPDKLSDQTATLNRLANVSVFSTLSEVWAPSAPYPVEWDRAPLYLPFQLKASFIVFEDVALTPSDPVTTVTVSTEFPAEEPDKDQPEGGPRQFQPDAFDKVLNGTELTVSRRILRLRGIDTLEIGRAILDVTLKSTATGTEYSFDLELEAGDEIDQLLEEYLNGVPNLDPEESNPPELRLGQPIMGFDDFFISDWYGAFGTFILPAGSTIGQAYFQHLHHGVQAVYPSYNGTFEDPDFSPRRPLLVYDGPPFADNSLRWILISPDLWQPVADTDGGFLYVYQFPQASAGNYNGRWIALPQFGPFSDDTIGYIYEGGQWVEVLLSDPRLQFPPPPDDDDEDEETTP